MDSTLVTEVSIILPVYNGELYIAACLDSVFAQNFQNYELIIINDGSNDCSESIILAYKDQRIRYLYQTNIGLAKTLNKGIGLAKGEFICRIDQDDLMAPNRILHQVKFLKCLPEAHGCGSWVRVVDQCGSFIKNHRYPTDYKNIQFYLNFNNPFAHSSIMLRKNVFDSVGMYSTNDTQPPEDYELWSRICRNHKMYNIPEYLVIYRKNSLGMSFAKAAKIAENARRIALDNIRHFTRGALDCDEIEAIVNSYWRLGHKYPYNVFFKAYVKLIKLTLSDSSLSTILLATKFFLTICYKKAFK